MKNIHTFHLLPFLLVLLLSGRCFGRAPYLPCPSTFQTGDHQYRNITTAHATGYDFINTTILVRPQRDLTVVLGVEGTSGKYYTEFSLGKDCFKGDWQWWELFVKVKDFRTIRNDNNQVWSSYKLQVRSSTCIKPCTTIVHMSGLVSLHVWATGASQWTLDHPGKHCGNISRWTTNLYRLNFPVCKDVHPSALSTTPAKLSTTTATPSATTACTLSPTVPTGVVGGVIAGAVLLTVVGVVAMVVVMKRDSQPTVKGVAVRPQNTR